jgi:hypothetical protein
MIAELEETKDDVQRQFALKDKLIKEKDAQLKEKDAQLKE